ncbi:MAG: riboflavin synthase [Chthoniobacterales bacterium]
MFTGLVEEVGTILSIHASRRGTQLQISAQRITEQIDDGDSVSVNGCCLTVASHHEEKITFDLLEETLARTNLKMLRQDSPVNLERALAAAARLGGHFVQGHIDCAARVLAFDEAGPDCRLEIELPDQFARYVVKKGSIAINGISLTVADVFPHSFVAWIIPHTKRQTNLAATASGDLVNLEFDLLAKYVERILIHLGPED